MCLLLVTENKSKVSLDILENAFDHNSDGWGVMWADAGRVQHFKQLAGFDVFADRWERDVPSDKELIVHFRFGTSGGKSDATCHPFKILSLDDGDPFDLYLAHNGVLDSRDYPAKDGHSDTMEYADTIQEQLKIAPGLLHSPAWIAAQENLIGGSKMVMLAGDGTLFYLNQQNGDTCKEHPGVWFSNLYSIRKVYSGKGMGKRAQDTVQDEWDWEGSGYYGTGGYGKYTNTSNLPARTMATDAEVSQKPWFYNHKKNHWWKPVRNWNGFGIMYIGMARDSKTGKFERDYRNGDFSARPPGGAVLQEVAINDVAGFENGHASTTTIKGGVIQVTVEGDGSATSTGGAVVVRKPQEPLKLVVTPEDERAGAEMVTAREVADVLEAQARDRDPGPTQEELTAQQWEEHTLRQMSESELSDLCFEDPDNAAIFIGWKLGLPWAFEPGSFDDEREDAL